MKQWLLPLAGALTLCGLSPAAAGQAPFGCDARAPNVCYFRIFYQRGDRIVILPAGMKSKVPGITLDQDRYCMALGSAPRFKCEKKPINAKYNS